jgi:hypothetical protein
MITLMLDKHALVKSELLHIRFGNTVSHTVNTTPNIQTRGLHTLRKGATTHCGMMGQGST